MVGLQIQQREAHSHDQLAIERLTRHESCGFSPERDFPFGIGGYTGDNGSRSIGTSLWLLLLGVFRGGFDLRLLLGRHTMTRCLVPAFDGLD